MRAFLVVASSLVLTLPAAARSLILIDFDSAPSFLPTNYFSALGVTIKMATGSQIPGDDLVTIVPAPAGLPAPASGRGITPYANLAGYMGAFEITFSTAIDYFSLYAFDGPQAFTAQAFRLGSQVGLLNIPAQPGRASIELQFGSIGSSTRIDRIVINPVPGIGGSDPDRGPKYYDALSFNTIPAPAAATPLLLSLFAIARRRSRSRAI